ncbi:UNVERIFIED_CONTAM: MBL fold metallo-hydrolase, partial [Kocuria sp. CPCC 205295]
PYKDGARLMTFCQSGLRNSIAASTLRRAGYSVVEVEGSYAGWSSWAAEQAEQGQVANDAR